MAGKRNYLLSAFRASCTPSGRCLLKTSPMTDKNKHRGIDKGIQERIARASRYSVPFMNVMISMFVVAEAFIQVKARSAYSGVE
jgi:hypothetical protein